MSTPRSKAVTPVVLLVSTSQRDLASRCQEQLLNSQKNKIVQTHPVINWQGSLATWPQTIAWNLRIPTEVMHGEGCVQHLAVDAVLKPSPVIKYREFVAALAKLLPSSGFS